MWQANSLRQLASDGNPRGLPARAWKASTQSFLRGRVHRARPAALAAQNLRPRLCRETSGSEARRKCISGQKSAKLLVSKGFTAEPSNSKSSHLRLLGRAIPCLVIDIISIFEVASRTKEGTSTICRWGSIKRNPETGRHPPLTARTTCCPGGNRAATCADRRLVGAHTGCSRTARRTGQFDPFLPFKVVPMNGRKAQESGRRQKARDAKIL